MNMLWKGRWRIGFPISARTMHAHNRIIIIIIMIIIHMKVMRNYIRFLCGCCGCRALLRVSLVSIFLCLASCVLRLDVLFRHVVRRCARVRSVALHPATVRRNVTYAFRAHAHVRKYAAKIMLMNIKEIPPTLCGGERIDALTLQHAVAVGFSIHSLAICARNRAVSRGRNPTSRV